MTDTSEERIPDMETWRWVWRQGFVPVMGTCAIEALREALATDDPRLIQGATTDPPPLLGLADDPVRAACVIGLAGWLGEWLLTVSQVEEYFATVCFQADQQFTEPVMCRWLLNWLDDTPRAQMRRELLAEVDLALKDRVRIQPSEIVNPAA